MHDPKRIFITGANSGLGLGLARHYAAPGVTLGLAARRRELLENAAADLERAGARTLVYDVDVSDTARMKEVIAGFQAEAGGADLVIANAGVGIRNALREGEAEEVAWLLRINVIGVTNTLVPFIPGMIRRGSGTLVGMSSFAGYRAIPGRTAYSTSKAAVRTFMDGLRLDLKGTGVHAMTISPGFVRTPLTTANPEMIFVIDVDQAVRHMARAIARKARDVTFPWQMKLLKPVVRHAPERMILRLAPRPRTRSSG